MTKQNSTTAMDQKIFELGLPMETVSVYLLCTGLADQGEPLVMEKIKSVWNADEAKLAEGIEMLKAFRIIAGPDDESSDYRLLPSEIWKKGLT